jgi:hypothetical protein
VRITNPLVDFQPLLGADHRAAERFYSLRREGSSVGRIFGVIGLE